MNYNTTKTTELVALAKSRDIAMTTVDGKVDRPALISSLQRDDAEQEALREDAENEKAGGENGNGAGSDNTASDSSDPPADGSPGESQANRGQVPGDASAAPLEDLPAVGDKVYVQFPGGRVEPAEVISHQGGDLLELRCTPRGGKPYHRCPCGPWEKGSTVAGWK